MAKQKKITEETEVEKEAKKATRVTPEDQIAAYLKLEKDFHYNFGTPSSYVVSSGSILLDEKLGGGIRPCIFRFTGITEGGKTSCALTFAANFQKLPGNKKVMYIKAEGRLSQETLDRTGIDTSPEKWFVYQCNVYESVIGLIKEMVKNNPTDTKYFFIIDSMDALCCKGDLDRPPDEANKVAGGAVISSDFLRKLSGFFSSYGHFCAIISQVRSTIPIQHGKPKPEVTNATGGNALLHYADWIFEFQYHQYKNCIHWEGEEGKSKRLGHDCHIIIKKSVNETTGESIKYPIKYGRIGGSIWVEREIVDFLLKFEAISKSGAWYIIQPEVIAELKEAGFEVEAKHQGLDNLYKLFEENPKITAYFQKKFREMLNHAE